ncbi:MAG: pyridoxal phosphate-dependent aminotransferase [Thermoguttaceae bacterium]|jgi:aspartate aminotransferase|nr:pyridoxal phosphate-dependent aminotransferase [Thermoguttaceae bacterium]
MPATISRIIQALEPSATMAMAAKAKELKAAGRTVYDLSLGEPDFKTPEHICQAAIDAIHAGHTHYTVASGIPELKQAVVKQYTQRHGLEYKPAQVTVANGAKHALHNAFTVLLNPGDQVVIPAPYWVSYAELVKLTGAEPVIVQTRQEDDFRLTPEQFRDALTDRTRMLLLCSPSNPTGSMYTPEQLGELADIAIQRDLLVLADEIYERLVYPGHTFASFATVRPGLQERTILVNGVSKTYAMTGWRIGWTLAPPHVAAAMGSLQSQQTSNPCSISQYASIAALNGPQECVDEMLAQFTKRREYVVERIAGIPGLSCAEMAGAFYAFINIGEHLGREYGGVRVDNSDQWCLELLAQRGVATVMGSAFGAEGYARISFATSMDNLAAAFDEIAAFVQ